MTETVTITLKMSTLHIVGAALQEIPYKLAVGAIREIEAEVQKSLQPKPTEEEIAGL